MYLKLSVLGQSDIKKLLRENYRLRSENWTLRDEYDRLDKIVKTKSRQNGHSAKGSHDFTCDYDDSYRCYCCYNDEVSFHFFASIFLWKKNKIIGKCFFFRFSNFHFRMVFPVIRAMKMNIV